MPEDEAYDIIKTAFKVGALAALTFAIFAVLWHGGVL